MGSLLVSLLPLIIGGALVPVQIGGLTRLWRVLPVSRGEWTDYCNRRAVPLHR